MTVRREAAAAPATRRETPLGFGDLDGWADDDHAEALRVLQASCNGLGALAKAVERSAARRVFETRFRPVLIEDGSAPLFTGYYEPELDGDLVPSDRFHVPLYSLPPEAPRGRPWLTRAEIEDGALAGRGLEIAWLEDPVEAFLLQVQGSGRIRLPDGRVRRLGYAGGNGQPYASVGRVLVARGALAAEGLTAEALRDWLRRSPAERATLLRLNASYVFFRELAALPPEEGPLGTLGRPVTALRSLAVDPHVVPLGTPVWIETEGAERLRRLMVADDTGSAIQGAQRADVFFGTGAEAGRRAGRLRSGGRMVVLRPLGRATAGEAAGPS